MVRMDEWSGRRLLCRWSNQRMAGVTVFLLVACAVAIFACESPPPRPLYVEVGEETRAVNGPLTVYAIIDPRETTVQDIRVEWGHGTSPWGITNEELIPQRISHSLPTVEAFTAAFTLTTTNQPLNEGDEVQYQFRLTHSTSGDDIFHWSEREQIVVDPYDWAFCADTLLRVSAHPMDGPSAPDLGGWDPAISRDGRFVAFTTATAFDANDANATADVYLADLNARTFARLSTSNSVPAGQDFGGSDPSISGDGQFVAFTSATPLTPDDTNNEPDVYRWSAATGGLLRVSWQANVPSNVLRRRRPSTRRMTLRASRTSIDGVQREVLRTNACPSVQHRPVYSIPLPGKRACHPMDRWSRLHRRRSSILPHPRTPPRFTFVI